MKLKIKLIIILCTVLFFYKNSYTQTDNVIFYDEFITNINNWEEISEKSEYAKVINGNYYIKTDTTLALRWFGRQIFIDYREDFRIEAKMKQTDGYEHQGYGIVWGSKGFEDSYFFSITSSGYFCIGGYEKGKYYEIKSWSRSRAILNSGNYNILTIEKEGIVLNFYVNDVVVYTTDYKDFIGQIQGFILFQNVSVAIDYFKVTSNPRKVDVATTEFSELQKENIGANINSSYSEIAPIISPDGKTLYVGRIYHPKNYGSQKECDIWYSELKEDGTWGKLKNIGYPLNNSGVNVVITVTPDGNAILLEGLYNSDGSHKSEQGISISYKTEDGWSIPEEVKIENFYNTNIYETYCFSNERKVLLMAIERDDTYGDMDLYVSFKNTDGTYSEPKNIGPVLNTFAGEGTPFLAQDNTTLYFSSYGHSGFGSADIFMTKRLDDTWLNWSKPKNLGKNINTSDWDTYFSLSAKGDYAYLVSTHNSFGVEDIFQLKLEEEMKPEPVVLIYGKVLNEETGIAVKADITYEDLSTGEEVGIAQSDPITGEYTIVLPYGIKYGFRADAENYISENENIDLTSISEYQELERDLFLVPFIVGETVVLNNIFFAQASTKLLSTSYSELDRLVKILEENPTMEIEIGGHTDNRGNEEQLLELSEQRAEAVKEYLVEQGIKSSRITAIGYGGKQTIYNNDSEIDRAKNRRVEFKILKK